jgi:hypothetical protein
VLEPESWEESAAVQGIGGFVGGLAVGYVPYLGVGVLGLTAGGVIAPGTKSAQIGRALGEIVGGWAALVTGGVGGVGGGVLCATGVGAAAGAPVIAGSAALMVGALGNIATGIHGLATALTTGGGSVAGGPSGFGGLSSAPKFGIKPYRQLRAELKGTGLHAHHLIEKRFDKVLGVNRDEMLSAAMTPAEHQAFTNAWRKAIPYGSKGVTQQRVLDEARRIYKDYPAILQALGL